MDYVKEFPNNKKAKSLFADYVKDIITRINRYTNISYVEDPTIMSWQIGNEPRAFSGENKEAFAIWMAEVSRFIKSLDRNHLVSTGSEGKHGCEEDLALFERIHADKHIDYMNIHIWPYNWGWAPQRQFVGKGRGSAVAIETIHRRASGNSTKIWQTVGFGRIRLSKGRVPV